MHSKSGDGLAAATASAQAKGTSDAEMGLGSRRGEALRFYARALTCSGCLGIVGTFLGLATCRALADWALGRWIVDGQQQLSRAALYGGLTAATVTFGCLTVPVEAGPTSISVVITLAAFLHPILAETTTTATGLATNGRQIFCIKIVSHM